MGSSNTTRTVAAALVIMLHALLLLIFENSTRRKMQSISIEEPVTYLILVPVAAAPSAIKQPSTHIRPQSRAITIPDIPVDVAESPSSTTNSPTNIDWHDAASTVAKEMARRPAAKQFRNFEPQDPCTDADPLNKFKPQCQKKAPEFEWNPEPPRAGFIGGYPYVRVSKKCIVVVAIPVCGFGKTPPANAELFEDLKPENLKKPIAEICSKTMANCNHSSSSSAQ